MKNEFDCKTYPHQIMDLPFKPSLAMHLQIGSTDLQEIA